MNLKCCAFPCPFGRNEVMDETEKKVYDDLLKNEKFDLYMYHCSLFECDVQTTFNKMDRPQLLIYNAHMWFREHQKFMREKWSQLLLDEEINLKDIRQYLIKIRKCDLVFKILSRKAKERVLMWQQLANYITRKMFSYRQRKLPCLEKIKTNFLMGYEWRRLCCLK